MSEDISHDHSKFFEPAHGKIDHIIEGTARDMAKAVLARHLCGWITGHSAPLEHFLIDANLIIEDMDAYGLEVIRRGGR